MKLPNKIYSYSDSVLSKFTRIIEILIKSDESVASLYQKSKKYFNCVQDFIDTLDCLYVLNKIVFTEKGEIHYVV